MFLNFFHFEFEIITEKPVKSQTEGKKETDTQGRWRLRVQNIFHDSHVFPHGCVSGSHFDLKKTYFHPMVAKKEVNNTETCAVSTLLSLLSYWSVPGSWELSCKSEIGPCGPCSAETTAHRRFHCLEFFGPLPFCVSQGLKTEPPLACRIHKHLPH